MYHAISNPTRNFSLGGSHIRRGRVKMALSVAIVALCVYSAGAVRISPKLDFGESSSSARPVFKTGNYHDEFALNPNFRNPNSEGQHRDCIGNYCDITKSVKSDSSSASTDVIVHVKTSIDVPKNQSENKVPDVPVIVGSKGPFYPEHFPAQPDINFDPNYPPSSVGINFVPEFNDDRRFVGYGDFFPTNNGAHRDSPELKWYPRPRVGEENVHNPLEFKKTYKNVWPTGYDNGWEAFTNKRDINPSIPPCYCDNQPLRDFPIARKLKQWLGE